MSNPRLPGDGLVDATWEPKDAIYRNSLALLQVVLSRREWRWQRPIPEHFMRVGHQIETGLASKLTSRDLARRAGLSSRA